MNELLEHLIEDFEDTFEPIDNEEAAKRLAEKVERTIHDAIMAAYEDLAGELDEYDAFVLQELFDEGSEYMNMLEEKYGTDLTRMLIDYVGQMVWDKEQEERGRSRDYE